MTGNLERNAILYLKYYFHILCKHLLVASANREGKPQLGGPVAKPERLCLCVCNQRELRVCLNPTNATWSIPHQKWSILKTVTMSIGLPPLSEIIQLYLNVEINSITGKKSFHSFQCFLVINYSSCRDISCSPEGTKSFAYIVNIIYQPARQYYISIKMCWIHCIAYPKRTLTNSSFEEFCTCSHGNNVMFYVLT